MKRNIAIIFIILVLAAACILEENLLYNTTKQMSTLTQNLRASLENSGENLSSEEVKSSFNELQNFWRDARGKICYFSNYDKIKSIDESIVRLSAGLENDEKSLVIENVASLEGYNEMLHYTMGFNINNLF